MSHKWQTIKLDLSSTFKDMHTERDHLLRVVFPELKARCRQARINLIEIDLRWGVTEKEAEDIADYFEGRWQEPYSRAIEELPYQIYHAGDKKRLKALLLNYQWIAEKLEVTDIMTLISDYDYLPDEPAVRLVQQALELAAHVLREDKTQLAGQLHERLLSQCSPAIQGLLKRAVPPFPWLRPLKASLEQAGGALIRTLSGHTMSVEAVAITKDGSRVVSGSSDKTLKVWDLASGQELHTLSGHTDHVNAVTVTNDGERLVSSDYYGTFKVWDLASGQELHTLSGHFHVVTAVTVTPDGSRVVSGFLDGTIEVWELACGQKLYTLNEHSDSVFAVTVTNDGSGVISCSYDKTLKVWDLTTGLLLASLNLDTPVNCCAVAPACQTIVAGDRVGKVHFLRLEMKPAL